MQGTVYIIISIDNDYWYTMSYSTLMHCALLCALLLFRSMLCYGSNGTDTDPVTDTDTDPVTDTDAEAACT